MLRKLGKTAQTTAEYAILIALVVAAVTAMQIYVKRGLQGKVRDVVNNMSTGMGIASEGNPQYEPYYLNSTANTTQNSNDNEAIVTGGAVTRSSTASTNATRNQTVGW